ncbi:NAD(P)-dependent oxidoreductase [Leeia sp. TBRC 13508]|uniref:NAD(P)-dependent oxidoreductase n=1 Tax=Leeia speluncae TaxID=2884804 RepID=A0ABS8D9N7_9NEIS|nr:NAD(P)-dependent oxidoreductase [Leeia speluncae]MCB6184646.1 NAD(P)-dependent oxidoreductase [Leeia speluncae]
MKHFKRVLITGAAGALGKVLRAGLADIAETLRLTDRMELGSAAANEELQVCDLADLESVLAATKDVEAIVHLGGVARENTFNNILNSNIVGSYNVYEAARKNGVKRIIFASSNHAIGFYDRTETIDSNVMHRPDSLYGLSKAFGEDLARYYFDKFGIESVCIRIGSCFPEPMDRRMLATWQSYDDFVQMVSKSLIAARVGFTVIYGMSDNCESFWDNTKASVIGYRPKDTADVFREKMFAATPTPDPFAPAIVYHGGGFAADGHFEDQ